MSDLSINAKEIIEECQMSGQDVMEVVADHGEDKFIHVADVELFSNNHDRMAEEIAELKGALESLHHIALLGDFGSEIYSGTLLESDVLRLLSQKGEE